MRTRVASLAILCLALAAVPAFADYENGPINGSIDAWLINFGYVTSDTFVADDSLVTGFEFGVWEFPGDKVLSVNWSVTSGESSGTVFGSGTASVTDKYLSNNQYYEIIDEITVSGLDVHVTSGSTYWLNLQNAVTGSGDPVYWDENSGKGCKSIGCPSLASQNSAGTIPSESFTINTSGGTGSTPEPGSFILFLSGVLGLAGMLRTKLL